MKRLVSMIMVLAMLLSMMGSVIAEQTKACPLEIAPQTYQLPNNN